MTDRCSVCEKRGVLYLVQLVGADQPLCSACLDRVSAAVAAAVQRLKDEHLLAVISGERHTGVDRASGESWSAPVVNPCAVIRPTWERVPWQKK